VLIVGILNRDLKLFAYTLTCRVDRVSWHDVPGLTSKEPILQLDGLGR